MSEKDMVYVSDRNCLRPRQKLFKIVYVLDITCLCSMQRLSMSQKEIVYVPDRDCRCHKQKLSMPLTGHNSRSWPPFDIKSSALDRSFHAAFGSNIFKD